MTPSSSSSFPSREFSIASVLVLFSVPALGGALFGYDIGATSFAISQIISVGAQEPATTRTWASWIGSSPAWQGFIVAAASLGAFLGSLWAMLGGVADRIGRRDELRLGALLYILGALMEAIGGIGNDEDDINTDIDHPDQVMTRSSSTVQVVLLLLFLLGRLLFGFSIGIVMHAAPTYLAEQCPSPVRGIVVSCKEAAIVFGILLGYLVGGIYAETYNGWKYAYTWSLGMSISMGALSYTIPRSCRWLLLKQQQMLYEEGDDHPAILQLEKEALESLKFVWKAEGSAERELITLKQALSGERQQEDDPRAQHSKLTQSEDKLRLEEMEVGTEASFLLSSSSLSSLVLSTTASSTWSFLWEPRYRAPLMAAVGLVILQQVSGQPSVASYVAPIFHDAGLSNGASVMVACFKLVTTLAAAGSVEKFGRKLLLYIGCSLMFFALILLSFTIGSTNRSKATDASTSADASLILLPAMFLYIGGYQMSFGPITWLIISEVFPLEVRGKAVAFAIQVNFLFNAIVQFGVPVISSVIGMGRTFGIFAILAAYSIYFVRLNVPETKGLKLEEIETLFKVMEKQRRNRQRDARSSAELEEVVLGKRESVRQRRVV